jgi:hypothetical protein
MPWKITPCFDDEAITPIPLPAKKTITNSPSLEKKTITNSPSLEKKTITNNPNEKDPTEKKTIRKIPTDGEVAEKKTVSKAPVDEILSEEETGKKVIQKKKRKCKGRRKKQKVKRLPLEKKTVSKFAYEPEKEQPIFLDQLMREEDNFGIVANNQEKKTVSKIDYDPKKESIIFLDQLIREVENFGIDAHDQKKQTVSRIDYDSKKEPIIFLDQLIREIMKQSNIPDDSNFTRSETISDVLGKAEILDAKLPKKGTIINDNGKAEIQRADICKTTVIRPWSEGKRDCNKYPKKLSKTQKEETENGSTLLSFWLMSCIFIALLL